VAGKKHYRKSQPIAQIGGYTIIEELGRGGMGVVFKAKHPKLPRHVAIKMISQDAGASEEQVARFQREAESAAKLAAHPNIVGVQDIGEDDGILYLVMDLVEGTPLDELAYEGELTPEQVADIGEQVAKALHHAHSNGILHRDVKPSNILITDDLEARLTDFGLAKAHDDARLTRITVSGQLLGTPAYMPPEQAKGEELDVRADIYSLGATMYEALSGEPPFVGESVYTVIGQVLKKDAPPLRKLHKHIPSALETIVLTCLQKELDDRYPSAKALQDDLRRFRSGSQIKARSSIVHPGLIRRAKRNPLPVAVGGLVILSATLGGALLFSGDAKTLEESEAAVAETTEEREATEATGALAGAYMDCTKPTVEQMQLLEDHWHGVAVPKADRDAALARIKQVAKATWGKNKDVRLPQAWYAMARFFGGEESKGLDALQKAVDHEAAKSDPFPRVFWARVQLARYAKGLDLPSFSIGGDNVILYEIKESEELAAYRESALNALRAAVDVPGWSDLEQGEEYRTFAKASELLADRKYDRAAEALAELIDDPVLGANALAMQGLALYADHQFAQSAAAYERVAQRGWVQAMHNAGMGRLCAAVTRRKQGGDPAPLFDQALVNFSRAIDADPTQLTPRNTRAICHWARGLYEQQLGNDPTEHLDAAVKDWEAYLKLEPKDTQVRINRGNGFAAKADYLSRRNRPEAEQAHKDAIAAYAAAAKASPTMAHALVYYASALTDYGFYLQDRRRDPLTLWTQARTLFGRALQYKPDHFKALADRGNLLRRWGQLLINTRPAEREQGVELLNDAVTDLTEAIGLNPSAVFVYKHRGDAYNEMGIQLAARRKDPVPTYQRAVRDFTKVLEASPRNWEVRRSRGGANTNMGNAIMDSGGDPSGAYRQGAGDLDTLLQARPDDLLAREFRGHCNKGWSTWLGRRGAFAKEQLETAIADYSACARANPKRANLWLQLGACQVNLGVGKYQRKDDPMADYRGGATSLDEAVKLMPRNATAWWFRGNAYKNLTVVTRERDPKADITRESTIALESYRRAVKEDPRLTKRLQSNIDELTKQLAEDG
jgi:tRNA A-37 threonylcarbamoyl transferase component Bud32